MFRVPRFQRLLTTRFSTFSFFTATLLCFGLLDGVVSGLPVVGLPLMRDQFHLSYEQMGQIFTISGFAAMLLEPPINLLSDRGPKRLWILGGLLGLGLSELLAGSTSSYMVLLLAFILGAPAGKAAIGLAQAVLIDQKPQESSRTMTCWTLLSSVGDLLAPLSISVIVSLHLGWSALCWLSGAIWLGLALVVAPQSFPRLKHGDAEKGECLLEIFKEALRDPILLRWSILSLLPTMLDEVFLAFAALYLRDVVHADEAVIAVVLLVQMGGALLGLFLLDRLVLYRRMSSRGLLTMLALLMLGGLLIFLLARTLWLAVLALFVIGLSVAGWYPIAKARAYAQRPGRSGLVRTVISLGAPFEVMLPGFVGLLAGRFGLLAGLGFLASAPVLLLLLLIGMKEEDS